MGEVLALTDYYEVVVCGFEGCHTGFAMPQSWVRARRNDHRLWYCPNGHCRHYTEETDADKFKRLYEAEQRAHAFAVTEKKWAQNSISAYKGKATKAENKLAEVKERVANGVCPCCRRNFKALAAHMKTKHPGYKKK